jgi:DNA-binding CsgD family transcriptional regulator
MMKATRSVEKTVRDIRRRTRKKYSSEEKIRIVLEGLSGEEILFKLVDAKKLSSETLLQNQLKLTAREAQVLFWISIGKTNRDIGKILDVSPRTVNKHLQQIFPKLGVENRTAVARIAISALNAD